MFVKTRKHKIQKIRKCAKRTKSERSSLIFKISETIKLIKESRGDTYDQLVEKAKKDFNIEENERWIQTRLRQLLIEENVEFQLLQISKSVKKEKMKITSRNKTLIDVEETMQTDNENGSLRSVLKCKPGKKSAKLSLKKVLFSDIIDIKYFKG